MNNEIQDYQEWIGQYFGKFKIEEFVAVEPSAFLFSGRHEALERKVAIRILRSGYDPQLLLEHFQKIISLEHENIATVYDVAWDDDRKLVYVVQQWIEAITLAGRLAIEGVLPVEEAIQRMISITTPLAFAHQKEVMHGNITPLQIKEITPGKYKLYGFGVVPIYEPGASKIKGPYGYMAPEQIEGTPANFSTDVYNLGCIFYQLLTGKLPYGEETDDRLKETRKYAANLFAVPDADRLQAPTRQTSKLRTISVDEKKKSYPVGLAKLQNTVPEAVIACLASMLAFDPQDRFPNGVVLLAELEKLLLQCRLLTCPRCGKQNMASGVFHCKECNTDNLCFSHLMPEKQCCDRCVNFSKRHTVTKRIGKQMDTWNNLVLLLRDIANNAKMGILVLGRKPKEIGLNILADGVEFCSTLPTGMAGESLPEEDVSWQIACRYLVRFLQSQECFFEFWENDTLANVLPDHKVNAVLHLNPGGYLISFSQVIRIVRDLSCGGGVAIRGEKQIAALLFTSLGVVVATNEGENPKPLQDRDVAFALIEGLIHPSCDSIQYRSWSEWTGKNLSSFPFSCEDFFSVLAHANGWVRIGNLLPEIHTLLPPHTDNARPFGGMELSQISTVVCKNLAQYFDIPNVEYTTGLSPLASAFLLAAIAKERILEIEKILLETIQREGDAIAPKNVENILLQASLLAPEDMEVYDMLAKFYHSAGNPTQAAHFLVKMGDIYNQMGDIGLALPAYERAKALHPQSRPANFRLLHLYDKLEKREKIKELGLDFFAQLLQTPENDEAMETVCKCLLKVDSSLAPCHNELIQIYLKRKDKKAATSEYEALIQIYERAEDKESMAKAMSDLLKLDPKRADIKKQLRALGYRDWRKFSKKWQQTRKWIALSIGMILFIVVSVWLSIRETIAQEQIRIVERDIKKRTSLTNHKTILRQLAGDFYFSDIHKQSLALLSQISQQEKKIMQERETAQEIQLWQSLHTIIRFYETRQSWKQALALCALAQEQFFDLEMTTQLSLWSQKFKEQLEQKEEELNQQAKKLFLSAKRAEEQKDYAHAVHIYYLILDNPQLQNTTVAKDIKLPLVIETKPARVNCFDDDQSIGKSPLVYYYKPQQFPFIKVAYEGKREYQRRVRRNASNQIWKIDIIMK